jgi:hypothetical protein
MMSIAPCSIFPFLSQFSCSPELWIRWDDVTEYNYAGACLSFITSNIYCILIVANCNIFKNTGCVNDGRAYTSI